jgi:hypothetical protein
VSRGACGRKNKGEKNVEKNKILLADFIQGDRFELNSYLTYLFNQIHDYFPKHMEDKMVSE